MYPDWSHSNGRRFIGIVLALFVTVASCSDDGGGPTDGGEMPLVPNITELSDTLLSPGDTLVVVGENFAIELTRNRVVFNNELAKEIPFYSSGDSLTVVVPVWANSGEVHVVSQGQSSGPRLVTIQRGIGEPWVVGGTANFDAKLAAAGGGEEYLIVPYSASALTGNHAYMISPDTAMAFPVAPRPTIAWNGTRSRATDFESHIREQAREHLASRPRLRPLQPPARSAPADTRTFRVLNCESCSSIDPGSYTTVTADLVHTSANALIYVDQQNPAAGFLQADYDAFGSEFSTSTFPTDTTFFGPPTDIDGNDRVIILFTRVVNELTPPGQAGSGFIAGFFLPNDLAPSAFPPGTSNGMEIFYVLAADDNGDTGNVFPRTALVSQGIITSTLAHELEHMISFGARLKYGLTAGQVRWLEEGMAHMAEDLNDIDGSNIARANLYLQASQTPGDDGPGNVSLFGSDTLEQRGMAFLFLRYVADQIGTDFLKTITDNTCKGVSCIELATGRNFYELLADFFATLYLSDRGITADARYNYSSFDFQQAFAALQVTQRTTADGTISDALRGAAAEFILLNGLPAPAAELSVTGSPNGLIRTLLVRTN